MKIFDYNFPEYSTCDKPRMKNDATGKYVALTTNKSLCPSNYKMAFEINGIKYYPRGIVDFSHTISLGTVNAGSDFTSAEFSTISGITTLKSVRLITNIIKEFCPGTIVYLENYSNGSWKTVHSSPIDSKQSNWLNLNNNSTKECGKQLAAFRMDNGHDNWYYTLGNWSNASHMTASKIVCDSSGSSTSRMFFQMLDSSGNVSGQYNNKDTGGGADERGNILVYAGVINSEEQNPSQTQINGSKPLVGSCSARLHSNGNLSRGRIENPIMWRKTVNVDYSSDTVSQVNVSSNRFRIRVHVPGNLSMYNWNKDGNLGHSYRLIAQSVKVSFEYY